MRIFCDLNVILDVLLDRKPFVQFSYKILELAQSGEIELVMSAISIDTLAYILKKNWKTTKEIRDIISKLLFLVDIAFVDKKIILDALKLDFNDLEDAIQCCSAFSDDCDLILTRNKKDFLNCKLKVLTPEEFLDDKI